MRSCTPPVTYTLLFPVSLCLVLVHSNDLTEVRVAGSSCEWDVPVIQCCLLFLFHCQLLAALTSMNSQPFLLLLRNGFAPATRSLSCMVLPCWRLSNYITCDITLKSYSYQGHKCLRTTWEMPLILIRDCVYMLFFFLVQSVKCILSH